MGSFSIETPSPEATERVGRALALELQPGDCVLLHGDLGAGKTCFVRGLAAGLGCDATAVHSPTFTVMSRYPGSLASLVHVDAYRVASAEELRDAGVEPGATDTIFAIEWPEKVPEAWPDRPVEVRITPIDTSARSIEIRVSQGTLAERVGATLCARPCPSCQTPVGPFATDWPFCGPRCRAADLGRWFGGHYQITRPLEGLDLEEGLE
jgi:tRNA threonylcarbamoyladenosine biosynthesis protein TsaE